MESVSPTAKTVTELNTYVKNLLDGDENLTAVFVTGEISNFSRYASGHLYLTLKDENAAIRAVMFAGYAERLRFEPEDGMKVLVFGSVSLYPKSGGYQLYIKAMQPDGLGALHLAFEKLKERFRQEGLFDEERKRPIPKFPQRVGVVTSGSGAAVRDIFNVLGRRYPSAQVILRPVQVQGEGAAKEIADAIALFNRENAADVLIVGRGGGSIEDLWAFNEEPVARAVAASKIPVISAVGHETDFTICDFVADLRAPTPSAAAELAVPDVRELYARLETARRNLLAYTAGSLDARQKTLEALSRRLSLVHPQKRLEDDRRRLLYDAERLGTLARTRTDAERARFSNLAGRLNALSPLGVLARGYAMVYRDGKTVTRAADVAVGDKLTLRLSDGEVPTVVTE
ncbi:MAG: exodeoxyribonuclease VII large subunit [Clostridia bacterium]|nr:exodeoxyribonuclease VII large subunit [Clostridia bacterium]